MDPDPNDELVSRGYGSIRPEKQDWVFRHAGSARSDRGWVHRGYYLVLELLLQ